MLTEKSTPFLGGNSEGQRQEHVFYNCKCDRPYCQFCAGGLGWCTVCGGFEGSLLQSCPGKQLSRGEHDENYSANLARWALGDST